MATYKFDHLNGGAEIVNPSISVEKDSININWNSMTVTSCLAILTTPNGSKFGIMLENMQIVDKAVTPVECSTLVELWMTLGQAVDLDTMVVNELQNYLVE